MADDERIKADKPRTVVKVPDEHAHLRWKAHTEKTQVFYRGLPEIILKHVKALEIPNGVGRTRMAVTHSDMKDEILQYTAEAALLFVDMCKENKLSKEVAYQLSFSLVEGINRALQRGDDALMSTEILAHFVEHQLIDSPRSFMGTLKAQSALLSAIIDPIPIICMHADYADEEQKMPRSIDTEVMNHEAETRLRGKRVLEAIQNPRSEHPMFSSLPEAALPEAKKLIDAIAKDRQTAIDEKTLHNPVALINSNAVASVIYSALQSFAYKCEQGRTDYAEIVKELGPGSGFYISSTDEQARSLGGAAGSQVARYTLTPSLKCVSSQKETPTTGVTR